MLIRRDSSIAEQAKAMDNRKDAAPGDKRGRDESISAIVDDALSGMKTKLSRKQAGVASGIGKRVTIDEDSNVEHVLPPVEEVRASRFDLQAQEHVFGFQALPPAQCASPLSPSPPMLALALSWGPGPCCAIKLSSRT